MRRTPIAHVIFPRPNTLRPVPEFAWEAVRTHVATEDLDVSVVMPVPIRVARKLHGRVRMARGALPWPEDLEDALLALDPKPTLVRYVPVPRRSTEAATAAMAAHLLKRARAGRPKVLHGSFLDEGGYAAARVGHVLGVPSVVVAHGTDVRVARGLADAGINRKRRALEALRGAARVLAVSKDLARELALLGTRAEVLQFTARASSFSEAPVADGPPEILFVGRVGRAKGVDLLLDAFVRVTDRSATLRLVGPLVGDLDVTARARELGIADRVHVMGEVSQAALPAHYQRSACFVLPSRGEGLPCVLIEALLVGRPVVATDVGGVREVVDDTVGRMVAPEDPGALARAIDEVLAMRRKLSTHALRERALPYTWESVGPRYCDITRSLYQP